MLLSQSITLSPSSTVCMNLEHIILKEVSQKEKNKHCILTHICGIKKNDNVEPMCRSGTEMQMEKCSLKPVDLESPNQR